MRSGRALWVALGVLALAWAAVELRARGPGGVPFLPGCLLRQTTGLLCPGCGMTRACHAVLNGRVGEAFRLNPLGMVLLPAALIGIGLGLLGWVRGRPLGWHFNPGARGSWAIVVAVLAFGILRNLPWWPFTLLSPS